MLIDEEKKSDLIIIRCKPTTKRLFRIVVAQMGAKNYEEALLKLIKIYKDNKEDLRSQII